MNQTQRNDAVEQFVLAALPPMNTHRAGILDAAKAMLEQDPQLATADLRCALLTGNLEAAGQFIAADNTLVRQQLPPHDWEPILFVCFSMFYRDERSWRANFHEIAKLLQSRGADPNTCFMLGDEKETALYGATSMANDAVMGADLNDEEASYHIAEHDTCDAIELFVKRGMKPNLLATALLHKLDCNPIATSN